MPAIIVRLQSKKSMIHPNAEMRFINSEIGYGVFATAFIPKGTMTYVKDALEIEVTPDKFQTFTPLMQEVIEKYSYIDDQGVRIISWDHAKYVNHCCHCNTMSTGYGFEIAIRDIQAGEEITDEYGLFNMEHDMEIWCAKPGCRGRIGAGDWDVYMQSWDAAVRGALANFDKVEQPLSCLLDSSTLSSLREFLETGISYHSVERLRRSPKNVIRH